MRYFISATFVLQVLLGTACMVQMQSAPVVLAADDGIVQQDNDMMHEECAKTHQQEQSDFSCLGHCLSQATERTADGGHVVVADAGAFTALPMIPVLFALEEGVASPETGHPPLSPPILATVVLRQ